MAVKKAKSMFSKWNSHFCIHLGIMNQYLFSKFKKIYFYLPGNGFEIFSYYTSILFFKSISR